MKHINRFILGPGLDKKKYPAYDEMCTCIALNIYKQSQIVLRCFLRPRWLPSCYVHPSNANPLALTFRTHGCIL